MKAKTIHGYAGSALLGFLLYVAGLDIADWQFYLILIPCVVWYTAKPIY